MFAEIIIRDGATRDNEISTLDEEASCDKLASGEKRCPTKACLAVGISGLTYITRLDPLNHYYGEVSAARPAFFLILYVIGHQMRMSDDRTTVQPVCQSRMPSAL